MAENRHGSTGSPRTVFLNLGFCRKSNINQIKKVKYEHSRRTGRKHHLFKNL
ncbi:hypothetical protein [Moraxella lacunata]|uniref:hypothetical protein n=1 Tax=Moraxella lacunata TaxID=477 RepID=UPI003EDFC8D0